MGKPEELLSGRSSSWFGAAPEQHLAGVLLLWQAAVQQGGEKKRRGHQEAFGEAGPPVEMQVWPPASLGRRRGRGAAAPVPQLDVCGREKKKEERGEKKGVDPTTSVRGSEGWK